MYHSSQISRVLGLVFIPSEPPRVSEIYRRLLSEYQKPVSLTLRFPCLSHGKQLSPSGFSTGEKGGTGEGNAAPSPPIHREESRDWRAGGRRECCPLSPLSTVLTPGLISRCPDKFKLLEPFIKSGPGAAHTLWLPKPSVIIHKTPGGQAPVRNGPRSGVPAT